MRREFILVLLGIICVSTLSSLLSGYVQIDSDKVLLFKVAGAVGAGNFSYWQLGHSGSLLIELVSHNGDADLYVSDTNRPSYELDKNNLSSATCGVDAVQVGADFPRPVGIGVFGHWSHSLSEYSIQVYMDTEALVEDQMLTFNTLRMQEKPDIDNKHGGDKSQRKTDEEPKPRFLKLLNILDMIFEMFVL